MKFSRLIQTAVLAIASLTLVITPAQAKNDWVTLTQQEQTKYGFTHMLILDATNCVSLSSNVAANAFPAFNNSTTTPTGYRVQNVAIKAATTFSGGGLATITLKIGDTTDPGRFLPASGVGTNVTSGTWYLGTNAFPVVYNAATNLVFTFNQTGVGNGLLTNLTTGTVEVYINAVELNKLNNN